MATDHAKEIAREALCFRIPSDTALLEHMIRHCFTALCEKRSENELDALLNDIRQEAGIEG